MTPIGLERKCTISRKQPEMLFSNNRYYTGREAVRSAILATAWLLVSTLRIIVVTLLCTDDSVGRESSCECSVQIEASAVDCNKINVCALDIAC